MNQLSQSSSAYLRSAAHQPVYWRPWGAEAFAAAKAEDKPILLDIGAVWCHWCHVMDRESYEDPAVAALINQYFIAIKVDRDERPDVDARYQSAISAISGQGGWPLTGFLTPDGRPFFGGTYFPPADHYGRPGFPRVLATMVEVFRDKKAEMEDSARSVMAAVAHNEGFAGRSGDLTPSLLQKMVASAVAQYDTRNGGFGSQPKFPHASAIDLLLDQAARTGDGAAREAALGTLRGMARGGMHDQLAGGFHRYSVDERWIVPHFEKMSYDNAELLRNYVHAFLTFGDAECAETALGILRFFEQVLSDRDRGGFYASQDADISLDDDGDYFTWTKAEFREVLNDEEFSTAAAFFNVRDVGDMHHDPARNVLHTPKPLEEFAKHATEDRVPHTSEESVASTKEVVTRARQKLYAARLKRKTPYVDKTIYTHWNGLCIAACFEAGEALAMPQVAEFARKSLDRVLAEAWDGSDLSHVVAYGETDASRAHVPGMLDDYAFLAHACLTAWEATAESKYFHAAVELADAMVAKLYDPVTPGFFDTPPDANAMGALSVPRKPLQDSPTPAGNPAAAAILLRLHALGAPDSYRDIAEQTLESFAGVVEHFGLYAGTYALALSRLLYPSLQVIVVGEDTAAKKLSSAAMTPWLVNKTALRFTHSQAQSEGLPPTLAETLPHLPSTQSLALVCTGRECLPPITEAESLGRFLAAAASTFGEISDKRKV